MSTTPPVLDMASILTDTSNRVIVCCGAGGVGKTTTAAAMALRAAEYVALTNESSRPAKYYVGRRLPALFAEAGLEPRGFRTQSIDRQFPLDPTLEAFLQAYLQRLGDRVRPHLRESLVEQFEKLIDPGQITYLPRQPHFTMTWINVLAWARTAVR